MKHWKQGGLIVVAVFFLFSSLKAAEMVDIDYVQAKSKTDESIKAILDKQVGAILPPKSYVLWVNSVLTKASTDEDPSVSYSDNGTINRRLRIDAEGNIVRQPDMVYGEGNLPGFENSITEDPSFNSGTTQREVPLLSPTPPRYKLESLNVDVVYDRSLSPVTLRSLRSVLQKTVETGFGIPGTLRMLPSDMVKEGEPFADQSTPPTATPAAPADRGDLTTLSRLAAFIQDNFWIFVALIFSSILFFLLLIFVFIWALSGKRERREKVEKGADAPAEENEAGDLDERERRRYEGGNYNIPSAQTYQGGNLDEEEWRNVRTEKESLLLGEFSKDPLLGRKYFMTLPQKDKNDLVKALSPSLRELFSTFIVQTNEGDSPDENLTSAQKYKKEAGILGKHFDEMRLYKQVAAPQVNNEFGRLALLNGTELGKVLGDLRTDEIAYVMEHIPMDTMRRFLGTLGEKKRNEIVSKNLQTFSADQRKEVSEKINARVDAIKDEIIFPRSQKEEVYDLIFDQSKDSKKLLADLKVKDEELYNRYKRYDITFDDFMRESDKNVLNKILNGLENDEVAYGISAMPEERREKYLNLLSDERKEIVNDIILTLDPTRDKEQILNGKFKLLNQYRALKLQD